MEDNGYNVTDLAMLVNSQEVKEDGVKSTGMLDHDGNDYFYEDSFTVRSHYAADTTDGGVIAGLSGYNGLDANMSNWGDQQVIRIEISPETLLAGGITEIRFFDFGDSNASTWGTTSGQQVNPMWYTFYADPNGNLYYGDPNDPNDRIYFPNNRIYIAVTNIPEPATLSVVTVGAGLMILLRRRRST